MNEARRIRQLEQQVADLEARLARLERVLRVDATGSALEIDCTRSLTVRAPTMQMTITGNANIDARGSLRLTGATIDLN